MAKKFPTPILNLTMDLTVEMRVIKTSQVNAIRKLMAKGKDFDFKTLDKVIPISQRKFRVASYGQCRERGHYSMGEVNVQIKG